MLATAIAIDRDRAGVPPGQNPTKAAPKTGIQNNGLSIVQINSACSEKLLFQQWNKGGNRLTNHTDCASIQIVISADNF